MEYLVVEVSLLKHQADSDSVGPKMCLSQLRLLKGAFTVGLVFSQLDDALLHGVIHVDTHFADHHHEHLVTHVTLLHQVLALVIDDLVELVANIFQCLASIIGEEGHILLQVHP